MELAGGPGSNIVVIPTGGGAQTYEDTEPNARRFKRAGAKVSLVHTRNKATASTDAFLEPLRKARGVWINGGSSGVLADAYTDTKLPSEGL